MTRTNSQSLRWGFRIRTAGLAAALVLSSGIPAFAQQTQRSDASIESDIVNSLANSPALKDQQITAATIGGDVTLSGSVRDAASKELAEMTVARVAGVRSVQNHLSVGASAPMDSAPAQEPVSESNSQTAPASQQEGYSQSPVDNGSLANRVDYPQPTPQVSGPVTIPKGTLLRVRTSENLDSKHAYPGAMVEFTSASDIYAGGALAIPRGAVLEGEVVEVQAPSGNVKGSQSLGLKLNSLILEGRTYILNSDVWTAQGSGKGGYTAGNTVAGAAVGAVIGAIAGGGTGAAIGAAAGGATGVAASAATSGPGVYVPAESVVTFHLAQELPVLPVSSQEAQRLAAAQPRPQMHPARAEYGYGYPPPPPPPVVYMYPTPGPYVYYSPYRVHYYYGRRW